MSWSDDLHKLRAGGHVSHSKGWFGALLLRTFTGVVGFVQVGPIRVHGRHRLPGDNYRILAANHSDPGDMAVVSQTLGMVPLWYLTRSSQTLGWLGWVGVIGGAITIDENRSSGPSAAFKVAINAMAQRPRTWLVMFPQGELTPDGVIRREQFKIGTMAIAKLVARKRKCPVLIVPAAIHYMRDPGAATMLHRAMLWFGFRKFRNLFWQNCRATVVIGKAMRVMPGTVDPKDIARGLTLPDDAEAATDVLVQRMAVLHKAARRLSVLRNS